MVTKTCIASVGIRGLSTKSKDSGPECKTENFVLLDDILNCDPCRESRTLKSF